MKIYGLVGHNIGYSLSPAMHNAAFKKLKLDAEYKIFDIKPEEIDKFLNSLLRSDTAGLNVTVPYKIKAYEFVKKYGFVDNTTEKLGAVNTIVIKKQSILGYNTDAVGFRKSLRTDLKFNPRGKNVFIFGAGGAGTACAMELAAKVKKMFILDIDRKRVEAFTKRFFKHYKKEKLSVVNNSDEDIESALKICHLVVNATPFGRRKGEILVNPKFLHKDLNVYDLIYKPPISPIVKTTREIGGEAVNGLGMLLYQGARAFELWTGQKPPVRTMKKALLDALKAK